MHFSGGTDSSHILETFIKNKIYIDEIFVRGPYLATKKDPNIRDASNQYAEIYFQSVPVAITVIDEYLKHTKLTVLDNTEHIMNWFAENPDWHEDIVTGTAPNLIGKKDWDVLNPEFAKLVEKGKKVCHIMGVDKPRMHYKDGKFYVRFLDKIISAYAVTRFDENKLPLDVEFFYWGKSTAELICKQAHTIKNYIKSMNLDPNILTDAGGRTYHNMVASILYQRTIIPMLYDQVEKSKYNTLEFDMNYFFNDPYSVHVQNWRKGIEKLDQIIPNDWKDPAGIVKNSLVGIWSKSYCIGS